MFIIRLLLCFVFPPLAVYLTVRVRPHFWLSVLFTLLGSLPGVLHGLWVVARADT